MTSSATHDIVPRPLTASEIIAGLRAGPLSLGELARVLGRDRGELAQMGARLHSAGNIGPAYGSHPAQWGLAEFASDDPHDLGAFEHISSVLERVIDAIPKGGCR